MGLAGGLERSDVPYQARLRDTSPRQPGDCGISSKESAFVLIAGDTFLPIGTREKMKNFLTSVLFCRACERRQFPSSNFTPPKTTVEMFRRGSSAFAGYFFPQGVILT